MNSYHLSGGVHVMVSDHTDSKVLVEKKGVSASAGTHTMMAFKQIRVTL